jgi:DNA-binding MarR family transcriptional regulator
MESSESAPLVPSIERATHAVALWIERSLKDIELTQAEAHVIAYLDRAGPRSINDLHKNFGHRRSTLTSVLDRLEGRGYVRREAHPTSRRSVMVRLTDEGREVGERVSRLLHDMESAVRQATTQRDIGGFFNVITAIEEACT